MYVINTLQRINGADINEQAIVGQALKILETRAGVPGDRNTLSPHPETQKPTSS